jgi:hypothetical protein
MCSAEPLHKSQGAHALVSAPLMPALRENRQKGPRGSGLAAPLTPGTVCALASHLDLHRVARCWLMRPGACSSF